MLRQRHGLAQVLLAIGALSGCALSHGLEGSEPFNPLDAGPDAGSVDAGPIDAGRSDAGRVDAGRPDAGRPDAGRSDAGPPDAGPPDAGTDGGVPASCHPQDAREGLCNEVVCDALDQWYWDGAGCFPVACGTCEGAECGAGYPSRGACEAEHTGCAASLCEATGGEWRWWDEVCGHYTCGFAAPETCLIGEPACDCPDGAFDPALGCVPTDCPDESPDPMMLCLGTGGTWEPSCCPSVCGEPCGDDCSDMACTCGPNEVFHRLRGCERGRACMERAVGQTCTPLARCEGGSLCCQSCSGAGCFGEPTCRLPVCDPDLDFCGNDPDSP